MPTSPVTYKLKDLAGDDIKGTFYSDELQMVWKPDDALFDIERIVQTRKRAGKVEYLAKWRGYPEKFNSWVESLTKRGHRVISLLPYRRIRLWTAIRTTRLLSTVHHQITTQH